MAKTKQRNIDIEIKSKVRGKDADGFLLAALLATLAHYYKITVNGEMFDPYENKN